MPELKSKIVSSSENSGEITFYYSSSRLMHDEYLKCLYDEPSIKDKLKGKDDVIYIEEILVARSISVNINNSDHIEITTKGVISGKSNNTKLQVKELTISKDDTPGWVQSKFLEENENVEVERKKTRSNSPSVEDIRLLDVQKLEKIYDRLVYALAQAYAQSSEKETYQTIIQNHAATIENVYSLSNIQELIQELKGKFEPRYLGLRGNQKEYEILISCLTPLTRTENGAVLTGDKKISPETVDLEKRCDHKNLQVKEKLLDLEKFKRDYDEARQQSLEAATIKENKDKSEARSASLPRFGSQNTVATTQAHNGVSQNRETTRHGHTQSASLPGPVSKSSEATKQDQAQSLPPSVSQESSLPASTTERKNDKNDVLVIKEALNNKPGNNALYIILNPGLRGAISPAHPGKQNEQGQSVSAPRNISKSVDQNKNNSQNEFSPNIYFQAHAPQLFKSEERKEEQPKVEYRYDTLLNLKTRLKNLTIGKYEADDDTSRAVKLSCFVLDDKQIEKVRDLFNKLNALYGELTEKKEKIKTREQNTQKAISISPEGFVRSKIQSFYDKAVANYKLSEKEIDEQINSIDIITQSFLDFEKGTFEDQVERLTKKINDISEHKNKAEVYLDVLEFFDDKDSLWVLVDNDSQKSVGYLEDSPLKLDLKKAEELFKNQGRKPLLIKNENKVFLYGMSTQGALALIDLEFSDEEIKQLFSKVNAVGEIKHEDLGENIQKKIESKSGVYIKLFSLIDQLVHENAYDLELNVFVYEGEDISLGANSFLSTSELKQYTDKAAELQKTEQLFDEARIEYENLRQPILSYQVKEDEYDASKGKAKEAKNRYEALGESYLAARLGLNNLAKDLNAKEAERKKNCEGIEALYSKAKNKIETYQASFKELKLNDQVSKDQDIIKKRIAEFDTLKKEVSDKIDASSTLLASINGKITQYKDKEKNDNSRKELLKTSQEDHDAIIANLNEEKLASLRKLVNEMEVYAEAKKAVDGLHDLKVEEDEQFNALILTDFKLNESNIGKIIPAYAVETKEIYDELKKLYNDFVQKKNDLQKNIEEIQGLINSFYNEEKDIVLDEAALRSKLQALKSALEKEKTLLKAAQESFDKSKTALQTACTNTKVGSLQDLVKSEKTSLGKLYTTLNNFVISLKEKKHTKLSLKEANTEEDKAKALNELHEAALKEQKNFQGIDLTQNPPEKLKEKQKYYRAAYLDVIIKAADPALEKRKAAYKIASNPVVSSSPADDNNQPLYSLNTDSIVNKIETRWYVLGLNKLRNFWAEYGGYAFGFAAILVGGGLIAAGVLTVNPILVAAGGGCIAGGVGTAVVNEIVQLLDLFKEKFGSKPKEVKTHSATNVAPAEANKGNTKSILRVTQPIDIPTDWIPVPENNTPNASPSSNERKQEKRTDSPSQGLFKLVQEQKTPEEQNTQKKQNIEEKNKYKHDSITQILGGK